MSQVIGDGVIHTSMYNDDASLTWHFHGTIDGTERNAPVSVKTDANKTVQIAAVDAEVIGRLYKAENRVTEGTQVCSVFHHGAWTFSYDEASPPVVGGKIVGAGGGKVKAAGAGAGHNTLVSSVDTDAKTCDVIFR
jgi:hypothetical protein